MKVNKIDQKLDELKKEGRIGLMTHVVVGYPSLEDTIKLVKVMAESGVDFVELQIPFSDPLADGPTIMRACEKALANGVKVKDAFLVMSKLSKTVSIPLLFMAYFNTIYKYGTEKFCQDAKSVGAAGLIVPDIPLEEEENEHFITYCEKYNLYPIRVISPSTTDERLKKNARFAKGFVYCTSRQGITGVKDSLDPSFVSYLIKVKKYFSTPLAVGFGISKKEHVDSLTPYADIAVLGSAIIDLIDSSKGDMEIKVRDFIVDKRAK